MPGEKGRSDHLAPYFRIGTGIAGLLLVVFGIVLLAYPAPFTSDSESTKTTTGDANATVVSTTSASPSDALVGGVFAFGGALILAAAFFPRVKSIKFAGTEIVLTEEDKEKLAKEGAPAIAAALSEKGSFSADLSNEDERELAERIILAALDGAQVASQQKARVVADAEAVVAEQVTLTNEAAAQAIQEGVRRRLGRA